MTRWEDRRRPRSPLRVRVRDVVWLAVVVGLGWLGVLGAALADAAEVLP